MGTDEPACESSPVWRYPSRSKNCAVLRQGEANAEPDLAAAVGCSQGLDRGDEADRQAAAAERRQYGEPSEVDVVGVRPVEDGGDDPAVRLAHQDAAQLHQFADARGVGREGARGRLQRVAVLLECRPHHTGDAGGLGGNRRADGLTGSCHDS